MRRLPPLGALRAFEAAARLLSFKQAADELNLTPTAISHHVRLLEDYCGRKLLRRRPRPLALTDVGAKLFPPLRDGFDDFAVALSLIDPTTDAQPLRVTTTNALRQSLARPPTRRLAGRARESFIVGDRNRSSGEA